MISSELDTDSANCECKVCQKQLKKKKVIECNDCSLIFCKVHIKVNDSDFSALCADCSKKRIHLEVSMEIEEQILKAKSELGLLKQNLKASKVELAMLEEKIESNTLWLQKSMKNHIEKCAELQRTAASVKEQNDDYEKQNKEPLLLIQNAREQLEIAKKKYNQIEKDRLEKMIELKLVNSEINKHSNSVQLSTELISKYTSYLSLRKIACSSCKSKIKKIFSEQIIKGNQGRNSLISSVINASATRKSLSKSWSEPNVKSLRTKHGQDHDNCKCQLF